MFSQTAAARKPEPEVDYVEYNWKKPVYFKTEHQEHLNEFAHLLTRNIAAKFSESCYCEIRSEIKITEQHYGWTLIEETLNNETDFFMQFRCNEKVAGFLRIPLKTAMAWVVHMLQDDEIEPNEKKSLSFLEENLLVDIAKNIINALSISLTSRDSKAVSADSELIKDKMILEISQLQEVYEFSFSISNSENIISDASIYIYSEMLDTIAGKIRYEQNETSPQKINIARQANLNRLYLPVRAELGEILISLSDLVSLSPGDVIKLEKPLSSSLQVKIKDKPSFKARPVQCNSKISLLIDNPEEN